MDGKFLRGGIKGKGLLLNQLNRILAENREPSFVDFANFCDANNWLIGKDPDAGKD